MLPRKVAGARRRSPHRSVAGSCFLYVLCGLEIKLQKRPQFLSPVEHSSLHGSRREADDSSGLFVDSSSSSRSSIAVAGSDHILLRNQLAGLAGAAFWLVKESDTSGSSTSTSLLVLLSAWIAGLWNPLRT